MEHDDLTENTRTTPGLTRRGLLRSAVAAGVVIVPTASGVATADAAGTPGGGPLVLPAATEKITRLTIHVPESSLIDLRSRLARNISQ